VIMGMNMIVRMLMITVRMNLDHSSGITLQPQSWHIL
jgi:hypothetical protein